ncbi:MAG: twin transmembrane helix small protein [Methylococcales bacterium]|nr:twin transmembrane helix small protein [Methylococcales bacterium]MDD5755485.1 twin transmembrane helix small protein [Methylococcales bacterium]
MFIKTLIIIAFVAIIASLGSALFHLVKHKDQANSQKTLKALTFRISLSVALFIFVVILVATGVIEPTGIGSRTHVPQSTPGNN